jgi:methylenetetrahydrofolate dehydrogenase (NADP+)/methenyltetrahydrofolate cyclohydrolase
MPTLLDGKLVRDAILDELRPRVARLASAKRRPGLAVVLVGSDPASEIYVRSKGKACEDIGMVSTQHKLSGETSTAQLLSLIRDLNQNPEVDGILVQLPLPRQINEREILLAVDPLKDVDGFHPMNSGNLMANRPGFRPCTPAGVMRLLEHYRLPIAGKHAVVVGRSDIVGKPMAMLLLHASATVTICHSKTADLGAECRRADILVAAIGRPAMITPEFVKPGAVVIDVGINRLSGRDQVASIFPGSPSKLAAFDAGNSVLVGDVHPDVFPLSSAYTPVPGGVGPLTIAMLMSNAVQSAQWRLGT